MRIPIRKCTEKVIEDALESIPKLPDGMSVPIFDRDGNVITEIDANRVTMSCSGVCTNYLDPFTGERRPYGKWEEDGARDSYAVATERAQDIIRNHKPTPLKPEVLSTIDDILGEAAEEKGYSDWFRNEFLPNRRR